MTLRIIDIANRFLAEEYCTRNELTLLKKWLSDPDKQPEVENWMSEKWFASAEIDSMASIESVLKKIQEYKKGSPRESNFSISKILKVYQRVAAFLFIPLLGLGIHYWGSPNDQYAVQFSETISPRGQKSQIELADGTRVWLNSDTKIKYPGTFGKNQRDVYLDGEAFFEVTKNELQPFVVHTSGLDVKVLGTKFNVKAYSNENKIEAALFEGKINLIINNPETLQKTEKEVSSGQSFVYSKTDRKLTPIRFPEDEVTGWKNNRLIFKDDTFDKLVKKVERWYDIEVVYDETLFNDRHLTVELHGGEQLDRVMKIVSMALLVNYKYENGKIILTPKNSKINKK